MPPLSNHIRNKIKTLRRDVKNPRKLEGMEILIYLLAAIGVIHIALYISVVIAWNIYLKSQGKK